MAVIVGRVVSDMRIIVVCVLSVASSGCWGLKSEDTARAHIEEWRAPAPNPCNTATRLSVQGPSPIVEGAIEVDWVRGERRLWLEDRDSYAVSNDNKHVAVAGYGAVSIWNADDGHLEKVLFVKGEPFNIGKIAWSLDDRALHLEDAQTDAFARTTASASSSQREIVPFLKSPPEAPWPE